MSYADGPRQLFTQASNPNAHTPVGSPYGSPLPSAARSPGPGVPVVQGGGVYAPSVYAPKAHASLPAPAPAGTHQGPVSSPPVGAPSFPQPQKPYVPTNHANEKATYQPQPSPAQAPQLAGPPAVANNLGPMAYHQVMQSAPPQPSQAQAQSPAAEPVMQQPAPTQPMGVGTNAGVNGGQYDARGEREWTHGLFDCYADAGTCAIACCFPCITYGQNKSRFEHLDRHLGAPHPTGGEVFSGDCMVHGLLTLCGFGWVLQIGSRNNVRSRYRIRGGSCGDCAATFFCAPCELTQESLELAQEERAYDKSTAASIIKG